MAVRGHFRSLGGLERVFRVDGTDLEVDADSVSSEWITDPEATEDAQNTKQQGAVKKKKKRTRYWRLRHLLHREFPTGTEREAVKSSSSSSSRCSSSSRSSSTSSSSESSVGSSRSGKGRDDGAQEVCSPPLRPNFLDRPPPPPSTPPAPLTDCRSMMSNTAQADHDLQTPPPVHLAALPRWEPVPHPLTWLDSYKRYRCVAVARGFLSQEDIRAVQVAASQSSVIEINDRKDYLAFKHRVWRFDIQLRAMHPELYTRLLALMHSADRERWTRLSTRSRKVYPEVEYIDYDVEYEGSPCFIEPHVDNKSAVTLVAMLSPPEAYQGGRSCFRRARGKRGNRQLQLLQGDAVCFRGEKLVHWITPVTSGRRTILQIELSRV